VEMGGTISAESPPGGGACFTIRVPIHRDLDEL
jgi:signal transduction histidine kinase